MAQGHLESTANHKPRWAGIRKNIRLIILLLYATGVFVCILGVRNKWTRLDSGTNKLAVSALGTAKSILKQAEKRGIEALSRPSNPRL